MLEMERNYYKPSEMNQGAIMLVLDLAEAWKRVSLPVVCAWATQFNFFQVNSLRRYGEYNS